MKPRFHTLTSLLLIALLLLPGAQLFAAAPPRVPAATPLDVVISEIGWAGTPASTADEWIELYNNTDSAVDLTGWTLAADDGSPSLTLHGTIPAHGYYLLERTDDTTIIDIPADWIGSFGTGLGNTGEALTLRDAANNVIDTANGDGGGWPAGTASPNYQSMERIDPLAPDTDANWTSNTMAIRNGHAANGAPLNGTPKLRNSVSSPAADLFIAKSGPAQIPAGGDMVYELRLGNWGNLAAAASVITDTLPAGVSFLSQVSPYPYSQPAPGVIVWDVGTVPFTLTTLAITLTGRAALTATGTLVNEARAATASPEVTAANNVAWAYTGVQAENADLVVDKVGPFTTAPDSPITYTLTISSVGVLDAAAVRVTDTLPAGVVFFTQTSAYPFTRPAPDTVVWTVGDLPTGSQALITFYGTVLPTATGTLTNVVTASTTASETNLLDNAASWRTTVYMPGEGNVVINEVAWAGHAGYTSDEWIELYNPTAADIDLAGWTLRAADGSPAITLTGVITAGGYYLLERDGDDTVSDIPADQIYTGVLGNTGEALALRDAGGNVVDTANGDGGTWPAGVGSPTYQSMERIRAALPDSDSNWASNDMVTRSGLDAGGNPINGTPKSQNSVTPLPAPDLVMGKAGPAAAAPGDPLTYVLTIANDGDAAATAVRITDTLPAGFVFAAQSSPFTFTHEGNLLLWDAGSLAPAAQETLLVTGTVALTAAGTLHNEVYAATAVSEVTTTNNLAWVDTLVQAYAPDLAVAKTGPAAANAGSLIQYALLVQNVGDQDAPDTVLTDTLPAGILFLSSSYTSTQAGPFVIWSLGTLGAGGAVSIDLYGQVAPTATGTVTNGVAAATSAAEPYLGNNAASWDTAILPPNTGHVVINEVAWAGTAAGAADEWMELYNDTGYDIDITGWTLAAADGTPSITLLGTIPARGYFLLERTDDNTVSDIPADQIYTGDLNNAGETLTLRDAGGNVVDTANGDGGAWPAGTASPHYQSMERVLAALPDSDANWASNDMVTRNGLDANGQPLNGTPKNRNSAVPPPAPDLAVDKMGPLTATAGAQITYLLAISSVGDLAAPDVRITDTLPTGVTFVSQSSAYPFAFQQAAPNVLVWTAAALPTGTFALIALHVQVAEDAPARLTNNLAAATTAAEMTLSNNTASWETRVIGGAAHVSLPLIYKNYHVQVRIHGVLYDGYQANDADEAVSLINLGTVPVDLTGWELCKDVSGSLSCKALPAAVILPTQVLWFARDSAAFAASFGHPPDYQLASWLANGLANDGDEVVLRDVGGRPVDALVFENGSVLVPGWIGAAVQPYRGSGNFGAEGQIIQRSADESTGRPLPDSDTAADWLQYTGDYDQGCRLLYPGWDLDQFFQPLVVTEAASVTVAVAPDYAAEAFLQALSRATVSIEAEFYELRHYTVTMLLAQKASQGVSVTVLLEGAPAGGLADQEKWACQQITNAGGACWFMFNEHDDPGEYIFDRYTFVHSKIVLIDRQWVVISSQNPTASGMPGDDKSDGTWGSRGVLLITDAPAVVARAAEIFDADMDPANHNDLTRWAPDNPYGYGNPPYGFVPIIASGGTTSTVAFLTPLSVYGQIGFELISSPESSLRRGDSLLGLVGRAGPGDLVSVEQMYEYASWATPTDPGAPNLRLEAYIEAARRGASVRILVNSGAFGQDYADISRNADTLKYVNNLAYCEGLDLQARLGNPTGYGIHNKMVLVRVGEQGYAHIGSINGSETSSKANREVAVQVASNDIYNYLSGVFAWDWAMTSYLLVSEVLYNAEGDDAGKEWVEIYNPTDEPVDLTGWMIGDALNPSEYGSGRYYFPAGTVIPAHGLLTIAQLAQMVPFAPDLEFVTDPNLNDPTVPDMVRVANWDGFGFALGNEGDEVILQDPSGKAVDVLVYGTGYYPGVFPYTRDVAAGHSLQRDPPERDTEYCSADFFDTMIPTPGQFPEGYHECGDR